MLHIRFAHPALALGLLGWWSYPAHFFSALQAFKALHIRALDCSARLQSMLFSPFHRRGPESLGLLTPRVSMTALKSLACLPQRGKEEGGMSLVDPTRELNHPEDLLPW